MGLRQIRLSERIARSFPLDENKNGKRIGIPRLTRLTHIRDTLMIAVANGVLAEMESVSVLELDNLVNEIEGLRVARSRKAEQNHGFSKI